VTVLYHPKTTLRLILYGFAFVALPLVIALGFAVLYMDRLVDQSQNAVYRAVEATRDSRQLTGQITTLERYARQYLILRDPALIEAYRNLHEDFEATALKLLRYTAGTPQGQRVRELLAAERELADGDDIGQRLLAAGNQTVAERFAALAERADVILTGSNRLIDREVQVLQETAAEAQRMLFGLAFALIPLSLLSVGVFTTLIARPIRQVDHAIHHLGDGNFDDPVTVSGPQDLQLLGRRLDWLRERLRDLEQQKTRFLQHISHELKTPLTAIRESTDLLSDGVVGRLNGQQEEIAQILQANARQLQTLIEDLLSFGTSQNHMPTLYLSRVELKSIVQRIAHNHKPTLIAKQIELDCELDEIYMLADREKFGTVVDNLLSNAIKFTPPEGRIAIRLENSGETARLEVTDSGPGVAPDERERIFDAFYQGRQRPAGYVKGSGLGLAIAREYVNAHQGTITVADHEGPGARLVVQLPLKHGRQGKA
jgi:two-component system sensor histidine kinase GlrK